MHAIECEYELCIQWPEWQTDDIHQSETRMFKIQCTEQSYAIRLTIPLYGRLSANFVWNRFDLATSFENVAHLLFVHNICHLSL